MSAVAENIEVADLEADLLCPEAEVEVVEAGNVCDNQRQECCGDEDIAAGSVATEGLTGREENAVVFIEIGIMAAGGAMVCCGHRQTVELSLDVSGVAHKIRTPVRAGLFVW